MAATASSLLAAASASASTSRAAIFTRRPRAASILSSSRSSCPPLRASRARALRSRVVVASAAPTMHLPAVFRVSTVVDVHLGDRSYPIYIRPGLLDEPELLQRHVIGKRVLVVTNTTVAPLYLEKVTWALTHDNPNVSVESVVLPDGEKYKDMDTLMKVFDKAVESRLDRRCTFVALGGDVIRDMCGTQAGL